MIGQAPEAVVAGPTAAWDGPALLAAIAAATDWLETHKDAINALNVYPVPDGDTGTNMSLTMRAAVNAARGLDATTMPGAGAVAAAIADGSLMGARGNSGVILSQIFRGFAKAIADRAEIDGRDFAAALSDARETAYKAVMRPVEGTMLTVIRVAAERAEAVAHRSPALPDVLRAALDGAREALAETPDLLDILRQAGVVDAGGQGVVYILDAMERYARGERVPVQPAATSVAAGAFTDDMAFLDHLGDLHMDDDFGYCTNFMLFGDGLDVDRVRADIAAMGESAVIVGDERMIKVHIHVLNPGAVLDYAVKRGELGQIKIDNMRRQTRALEAERAERARARSLAVPNLPPPVEPVGQQAVLAVASGDGLAEALRSMGATEIVPGGQSMNPSIEELLAAVEAVPVDEVILLPNNANILLTANHVPELTTKGVRVVPSRSIPQALAALGAFNAEADLDTNDARMRTAMTSVRTVEVTCAVRDAAINGVAVRAQQALGLLDGAIAASGEDEVEVASAALAATDLESAELVTIFMGDGATAAQTDALRGQLERSHPHLEVQVYPGGQPHYLYVIAVE